MIDLSRLVTGYCPDAFAAPGLRERFFKALFKAAEWSEPGSSPLPKYRETNNLLLFRTLANAFQEGAPVTKGDWVKDVWPLCSSKNSILLHVVYLDHGNAERGLLSVIDKTRAYCPGDDTIQVRISMANTACLLSFFYDVPSASPV